MTVIVLVAKKSGAYSGNTIYHDKGLADTALTVDNAAFAAAQDRLYDVKGLEEIWAQFKNTGANSIDMLIQKSHKEFTDIADLVDADFATEVAEAAIAAAAKSTAFTKVQLTPEITALRFRFKETAGGSPGAVTAEMGLT